MKGKAILGIIVFGLVAACTTVQTRTTAEVGSLSMSADEAFDVAKRAALEAGLTLTSVDSDNGFITATRGANAMLTYQNPVINISVDENAEGTSLFISSTVGGQMVDYGTTASTIEDFCSAITRTLPGSRCAISR